MLRYSAWLPWLAIAASVTIAGTVHQIGPSAAAQETGAVAQPSAGPQGGSTIHYVGPEQLAQTNSMLDLVVKDIEATASDGRHLGWSELSGGLPVVMVFIKNGCPCSIEFEPYFHRVEEAYRGVVRFVGIIDADVTSARRYASEQHVPYPVLADAERKIIRRFRAKNGCYVAVLTADGVIDGYWPGSSEDALRELGQRIAKSTATAERPLDVSGMPKALTTGCHFSL